MDGAERIRVERAIGERRRQERVRTLKAMAIFFAVSILVTAFAYRPATALGVDGDALAHSVGGGELFGEATCTSKGNDRWRCDVYDARSSGNVSYEVNLHGSFGCWDAQRGRGAHSRHRSGCIDITDVLSLL